MRHLILILFLCEYHAASEQHDIVWGQYVPPQVTVEEVASALETTLPMQLVL